MPIIAKGTGDFIPAPQGQWPAVCVDVVDQGIVQPQNPQFKPSHRIQIRWVLDAEPALGDGRPHMASRSFGLSLGEKSLLRPFLEAWRGRSFTDEELQGFDVETVIGANCLLQVIHKRSHNGKPYANITSVMPLPKGMKKMVVPADYVRQEERDRRAKLEENPDGEESGRDENSDEPFYEGDIPF